LENHVRRTPRLGNRRSFNVRIGIRPDHTADEQVEAVVELSQSALDSLGLKPGMIKPL